mgnify:CR=1 FL=1
MKINPGFKDAMKAAVILASEGYKVTLYPSKINSNLFSIETSPAENTQSYKCCIF